MWCYLCSVNLLSEVNWCRLRIAKGSGGLVSQLRCPSGARKVSTPGNIIFEICLRTADKKLTLSKHCQNREKSDFRAISKKKYKIFSLWNHTECDIRYCKHSSALNSSTFHSFISDRQIQRSVFQVSNSYWLNSFFSYINTGSCYYVLKQCHMFLTTHPISWLPLAAAQLRHPQ